jgi:hypothetical protein
MAVATSPGPHGGSRLESVVRGLHRGHTRAIVASAFVVTLLLLQFMPPHGQSELVASMRTLSVAVLAFYFGSRTAPRKDKQGGD